MVLNKKPKLPVLHFACPSPDDSEPKLISTGKTYDSNKWYRFELEFDNNADEKGKFKYYYTELGQSENKIYIGEYDFFAEYGKLKGTNVIRLGIYDPQRSGQKQEILYDNIIFNVEL